MVDIESITAHELVTIVIVNYETSAYVRRCIESLQKQNQRWEAVIVDNPSDANDYAKLPEDENVRVVRSPENVGYGLGCNLGAAASSPESAFICILNPDTAVPEGELSRWVGEYYVSCPDGGILGPALHNDNGAIQRSSYRFTNGFNYWLTHSILAGFLINRKKGSWTGGQGRGFARPRQQEQLGMFAKRKLGQLARPTDWLMGAALLINRDTWNRLGGFSDKYFLYSEDTDLCWRCKKAGLPVIYDPGVHIWHSQGDPSADARETGIVRLFDGMKRFVDTNYRGLRKNSVYFSVIADMVLRLVILLPLKLVKRKSKLLDSRIRGYRRVLKQWMGKEG